MAKTKYGRLPYCNPKCQYQPGQLFYELKGDAKRAELLNTILYGVGSDVKDDRLRKYLLSSRLCDHDFLEDLN